MPPLDDGLAEYSYNLLNELKNKKNIEVNAIAQKGAENKIKGIKVNACWEKNHKISEQIINELKKENPDLVHIQFLAGMFRKKNIISLIPLFRFIKKYKVFMTIHSDPNKIPFKKLFSKIFFSNVEKFFVLSDYQKNILNKKFNIDNYKIIKIPHGCYGVKNIKTSKGKEKNILCFGFIRRGKGIKEAVVAFEKVKNQLPNTKLMICGKCDDEQYLNEIDEEIKKRHLYDDVIINNKFLNKEEISKTFSKADLIIDFPVNEGGPSGSINMAAAYGKASICADTEYLSEYCKNSKAGIIVPKGNYEILSEKIIELLKNNQTIKKMQENAKKYYKKNSFKQVAKIIAREYKK